MPTINEIQYPQLTYCQKYDYHCPCKKCPLPPDKKPNIKICLLYYWNNTPCSLCEDLDPSLTERELKMIIAGREKCPHNPKNKN